MPRRKATVRVGWTPDAPAPDVSVQKRRERAKPKSAPRVWTELPSEESSSDSDASSEDEQTRGRPKGQATRRDRGAAGAGGEFNTKSPGDAVAVNDRRSRWAPGQWEAWKEHFAKEEALNATLPRAKRKLVQQIVDEFNDVHVARGWHRKTVHSIRAQRSRVGEADPTYRDSRLSQAERRRALELFQLNGRSWAKATELFNEETGRSLTRGALMQSTRRMSPTSLPQELTSASASAGASAKRSWTNAEVQALLPLKQTKAEDLHAAYIGFLETMKAQDANYVPRTYQGFLTELGLLRRSRT